MHKIPFILIISFAAMVFSAQLIQFLNLKLKNNYCYYTASKMFIMYSFIFLTFILHVFSWIAFLFTIAYLH